VTNDAAEAIRLWDEWARKALPSNWHWVDEERDWACDEHNDIDCKQCPMRRGEAA